MNTKKRLSVAEQRRLGLTKSHDELWAKYQFTDEEVAQARADLERLMEMDADRRPDGEDAESQERPSAVSKTSARPRAARTA